MINNNRTISLVMPTYNRDYIINLAIKSIVQQQSYSYKIELMLILHILLIPIMTIVHMPNTIILIVILSYFEQGFYLRKS